MTFLTIQQAAARVGKTERTLRSWKAAGLPVRAGLVNETDLLAFEKKMRESRGRGRRRAIRAAVLAAIVAERGRQDAKWGEQNHPDGTGDDELLLRGRSLAAPVTMGTLAYVARATTDAAAKTGTVTWADILLEEVGEAFAESNPAKLRAELVQVAAVAAQWVEAIDRREA